MLLQLEKPQDQIAQGGHHIGAGTATDLGGIFAQAHIPAVMGSVFAGRPVPANELQQCRSGVLVGRGTGGVEAVFFNFLDDLAGAQFFLLPPNRDELPAAAQPRFFRTQTEALEAPADQAPVLLDPARVVFGGKKNLGATGFEPAPECHFDCL